MESSNNGSYWSCAYCATINPISRKRCNGAASPARRCGRARRGNRKERRR